MQLQIFKNSNNKNKNYVNRKEYSTLKIYYSHFTTKMKNYLEEDVKELYDKASAFQANIGNKRTDAVKKVDTLSGVIAEYATVILFNEFIGDCHVVRGNTENFSYEEHVDITLTRNNIYRNVEVRSSFVDNGIEFALFNTTSAHNGQYFNVIGPYRNRGYKKEHETEKDYYVRVLFDNRNKIKDDYKYFLKGFYADEIPIFIIGAATKKLFNKRGFTKNFNS